MLVTMINGVPWWYFQRLAGPWEGRQLDSVDPGGELAAAIEPERLIGSVVYPAAELVEPGVVRVIEGNRFTLGELDGSRSERIEALSKALMGAGFKAPVARDIRSEIWVKLWGNLSFNPITALTHATLEDICRFAPTRALAARMMAEAQAVAEALGVRFKISLEQRIAGAEAVGAHKTSMLQDVEAGRRDRTGGAGRRGDRARPHHRRADADGRGGARLGRPAGAAIGPGLADERIWVKLAAMSSSSASHSRTRRPRRPGDVRHDPVAVDEGAMLDDVSARANGRGSGSEPMVCQAVYLLRALTDCPKCGGRTPVFAMLGLPEFEVDNDPTTVVRRIGALPSQLEKAVREFGDGGWRRDKSEKVSGSHWHSHCKRCAARLGESFTLGPDGPFQPRLYKQRVAIKTQRLSGPFVLDGAQRQRSLPMLAWLEWHRQREAKAGRAGKSKTR